jgi:hypothetical protein
VLRCLYQVYECIRVYKPPDSGCFRRRIITTPLHPITHCRRRFQIFTVI